MRKVGWLLPKILVLLLPALGARADFPSWNEFSDFGSHSSAATAPIISLDMDPHDNLNTSFRIAAREARISDMKKLAQQGADVNSRSDTGETALMYAARNCFPKVVDFLMKTNAFVNVRDLEGRTALMHAAMGSCKPVVALLLKAPGIRPSIRDHAEKTALDYAENETVMDVDGPSNQIADMLRALKPNKEN